MKLTGCQLVCVCVFVEVMDAHLQNNQTAEEDDILASPDRLKGSVCTHTHTHHFWLFVLNVREHPCVSLKNVKFGRDSKSSKAAGKDTSYYSNL